MSVTNTYEVSGMTCSHCVASVSAAIDQLPGVREVTVELATGKVVVTSDAPLAIDEVRHAVDEAGYQLAGVQG